MSHPEAYLATRVALTFLSLWVVIGVLDTLANWVSIACVLTLWNYFSIWRLRTGMLVGLFAYNAELFAGFLCIAPSSCSVEALLGFDAAMAVSFSWFLSNCAHNCSSFWLSGLQFIGDLLFLAYLLSLSESRQNFGVSFKPRELSPAAFAKILKICKVVGAQRQIAKVDLLQTFWDLNLEVLSGPWTLRVKTLQDLSSNFCSVQANSVACICFRFVPQAHNASRLRDYVFVRNVMRTRLHWLCLSLSLDRRLLPAPKHTKKHNRKFSKCPEAAWFVCEKVLQPKQVLDGAIADGNRNSMAIWIATPEPQHNLLSQAKPRSQLFSGHDSWLATTNCRNCD